MSITLSPFAYTNKNPMSSENQNLVNLCFDDFKNNKNFGFGSKRIAVNIEGTVTQIYPFRAFGYRDEKFILHVGLRKYYDQGNDMKTIQYNPNNTITDHIVALVQQYQNEYQQNINKTSLNTSGF